MAWEFSAPLWKWTRGNVFFVTVPDAVSDDIAEAGEGLAGGFGSVRVEVVCGGSTWSTSLFPSTEQQAYVLPVKKAVRVAEGLTEGASARVRLRLLSPASS